MSHGEERREKVRGAIRIVAQEKREQLRGSRLKKEDSQERELCVEKKIKRREQSVAAFEKDN